jgi:acetoin utilization deacetylase AcuC-like enzyme
MKIEFESDAHDFRYQTIYFLLIFNLVPRNIQVVSIFHLFFYLIFLVNIVYYLSALKLQEHLMSTGYVYDDLLLYHYAPGHIESPERLKLIIHFLKREGLLEKLSHLTTKEASEEDLLLVHDQHMIQRVREAGLQAPTWLDPDTYVSSNSYQIAKYAAGSGIKLVSEIASGNINNGIALIRPPGHHATTSRSMGFCLFNNIAVAARYLQKHYDIKKVAIIDWDVHHGNGTQDIFYSDPSVLYMSTHLYPHYPGTGRSDEKGEGEGYGTIINFPLSYGCSKKIYDDAFEAGMHETQKFHPDFVLISAGFDAHLEDPLGGLPLQEEDFARLTSRVCQLAVETCQGRIASFLEGGYHFESLPVSVSAHIKALLEC